MVEAGSRDSKEARVLGRRVGRGSWLSPRGEGSEERAFSAQRKGTPGSQQVRGGRKDSGKGGEPGLTPPLSRP